MTFSTTRREALIGAMALSACAQSGPADPHAAYAPPPNDPRFAAIEERIGGRVGVAAWNTGTGVWLGRRIQERFALCSTFKWVLAAVQMLIVQEGGPQLTEHLRFNESDLLDYAPVAREHRARGWLTLEEACEGAVKLSDNTAANLLLEIQGGPRGFTQYLRANGDGLTRLDRYETELNDVPPGDERDTTTPDAMARTLKRFLLDDGVLTPAHREKLLRWMMQSPTGLARLRAGFPAGWRVADKTGTWNGENNATNTVAIVWPPNAAPIVVAAYLHRSAVSSDERNAAHAEIARIIAEEWA